MIIASRLCRHMLIFNHCSHCWRRHLDLAATRIWISTIHTIVMEPSLRTWLPWGSHRSTTRKRIAIKCGLPQPRTRHLMCSSQTPLTAPIISRSLSITLRAPKWMVDPGFYWCQSGYTRKITICPRQKVDKCSHFMWSPRSATSISHPRTIERRKRAMFTRSHRPSIPCGTYGVGPGKGTISWCGIIIPMPVLFQSWTMHRKRQLWRIRAHRGSRSLKSVTWHEAKAPCEIYVESMLRKRNRNILLVASCDKGYVFVCLFFVVCFVAALSWRLC